MAKLSAQTLTDGLTPIVAFTYPTAADRLADTNRTPGTIALAVDKVARQVDTGALYRVATLGPLTWQPLTFAENIVTVGKDNSGDFGSVKAAVDSITTASASNPFVVHVAPGVYSEDPFSMKSYVTVCGATPQSVVLQTTNNATHFITGASNSWLSSLAIEGPTGVGWAAYYHTEENTDPAFIRDILIRKGYYGVWANQATSRGSVHCIQVGNEYVGTAIDTFIRATGYGAIVALYTAFMNGPSGACADTVFYAFGPNTELYLDLCTARAPGSVNGILLDNGAFSRIVACSFTDGTNAIHIGATGTGTELQASGCSIRDSMYTKDIWIENVNSTVSFTGVADKNKITNVGGSLAASFADNTAGEAGHVVLGELWVSDGVMTPIGSLAKESASTGWVSGGAVTRNAGLTVDVSAGVGYINTGSGVERLTWSAATALALTADSDNWIYVNSSGTVSKSASRPDHTSNIILGAAYTDSSNVIMLSHHAIDVLNAIEKRHAFAHDTHGPLWVSGLAVTENGTTPLRLDVDAGTFYTHTDKLSASANAPITFTYWYRDGSGGWSHTTSATLIDTAKYDDGSGTLATMTASQWKKDSVYVVVGGDGTEYHVVYAQQEYTSQVLAEAGVYPSPLDLLKKNACIVAGIVVQQGASAVGSVVDARPQFGIAGTGLTGSSDHGLLSGLSDDDHAQYLLINGTRAMSGGLNMGTNAITNVGNVDGVDVSAHAARHQEGGADAISNATTSVKGIVELATDGEVAANVVVQGNDSRLVFGTNFSQVVSATRSTTTLLTPQTKVTMATPALVSGETYRVAWSCVLDGAKFELPVVDLYNTTDAAIVGVSQGYETQEATDRHAFGGIAYLTGLTGSRSLSIRYHSTNGATVGIADAHIEFWRVS